MLIPSTVLRAAECSQTATEQNRKQQSIFFHTEVAHSDLNIRQFCKSWPPAPLLAASPIQQNVSGWTHDFWNTGVLYATITTRLIVPYAHFLRHSLHSHIQILQPQGFLQSDFLVAALWTHCSTVYEIVYSCILSMRSCIWGSVHTNFMAEL